MNTVAVYITAAITEIGGCFAFWAWLRLGRSSLWGIVGAASLVIFGVLLTRSEVAFAGRAYAAYGGVYIAASLLWLYIVERVFPDRWDMIGAGICLVGAGLILWGPRPLIQ
jgi:small multidrug resistance family-3 protein